MSFHLVITRNILTTLPVGLLAHTPSKSTVGDEEPVFQTFLCLRQLRLPALSLCFSKRTQAEMPYKSTNTEQSTLHFPALHGIFQVSPELCIGTRLLLFSMQHFLCKDLDQRLEFIVQASKKCYCSSIFYCLVFFYDTSLVLDSNTPSSFQSHLRALIQ